MMSDQDLELKLDAMRYLWKMGYYVRYNINIFSLDNEVRRFNVTDIDVLGVKFDESFNKQVIICDCRTGTSANNERIMFIGGLMSFLNAISGIFVRDKIDEGKYSEIAKKLNIRILSGAQLKNQLSKLGFSNADYAIFRKDDSKYLQEKSSIKRLFRHDYEYLTSRNWFDTPNQRILTLALICKEFTNSPQLGGKVQRDSKMFWISYTLSQMVTAIIDFAKEVLFMKEEDMDLAIKQNLVGGRMLFQDKRILLGSIYDFVQKEIKEKYSRYYNVSKADFTDSIAPIYAKHLSDFIVRLCRDPTNAIKVPQLMDMFTFECFLHNTKISDHILEVEKVHGNNVLNLVKDFIIFASRSELIDADTKELFDAEINSLSNLN